MCIRDRVYSAGDVVAESLTTGTDGQVVLSDLHLGTYVVTELSLIHIWVLQVKDSSVSASQRQVGKCHFAGNNDIY